MMEHVSLGRSGLRVSRLCLGTMNFGKLIPEEDCHRILDRTLDLGIMFIDTADVYGGAGHRGRTEEILGRWLSKDAGRRGQVVLATKVYGKMGDGPNDAKLSAYHIRRACEASLRRLRTDHIDLYQMHHIDRNTPWEEIWQAMEQLIREGKVTYIGSSNFAAWNIAQANGVASARHDLGLVSEQSLYNLVNRSVELEVIPACRALGLGFLPWSPLAGGVLAGTSGAGPVGRRGGDESQKLYRKYAAQVQAYEAFCRREGLDPAHVAFAWLLSNPAVTAPIIGPRSVQQLENAITALSIKLSDSLLRDLDAIWPGPGGEAPEAYAW